MFEKLLVLLDGSVVAERALPYAAALARAAGGVVLLVHVPPAGGVSAVDLEDGVARLEAEGVKAEAHVRAAAAGDETADALLAAAGELDADLLVTSTHGRGGLVRLLLGSVADRLLRRTDRPVLLLPPACPPAWPTSGDARVVVALDGSSLAEEALAPARELAAALDADLVLLSVVVPPPTGYGYFEEPSSGPFGYNATPALAEARGYLQELADRLTLAARPVRIRTAVGPAAPTITRLAAEEGAWATALATHGHGGLARLVLGSVAAETLQRTALPLLVVHPSAVTEDVEVGSMGARR